MFGIEEVLYAHLIRHVGVRGELPDFKGSLAQQIRAIGTPHLGNWHRVYLAVAELCPDITFGVNYTSNGNIITAKNLTVNAGFTLTYPTNRQVKILACNTLTVNGSIVVPAGGANGGDTTTETYAGAGGSGGSTLFIFANKIQGSGIISANGGDGGSGTGQNVSSYYDGAAGNDGNIPLVAKPTKGLGGRSGEDYSGVIAGGTAPGYDKIIGVLLSNFILGSLNNCVLPEIYAAGGGEGGVRDYYNTYEYYAGGGTGGGSWTAAGGESPNYSGSDTDQNDPKGGGGGGGGGLILAVASTSITTVNIHAKGGNGGNPYDFAEGGSGGGGGLVIQISPSTTGVISVLGGAGGTRHANIGGGGTLPSGANGYSSIIPEVW